MIKKIVLPLCLSLFFMCNDDECTPIQTAIEVVYPKGGETFTVGELKTIQWKVNPQIVGQVQIEISLNDGRNWSMLYGKGIDVTGSGNVACMDATWKIGEEIPPANYASTNSVVLRVGKYGAADDICSVSPEFIVKK